MSSAVKKSPAAGPGSRRTIDGTGPSTPSKTPTRPAASPSAANGTARTRSVRSTPVSARAAALQRSGTTGSSLSISSNTSSADEEAHAETVSVIEELKERLKQAEISSEQYQKQAESLQARLDESHKEQEKLEDRIHESEERIEGLENEKREMSRQKREMEAIYEAERSAMTKEKEEMANREEEMQTVIQRLKDNLNQRNSDENRMSRQLNSPILDDGQFAPSSAVQRSDSRASSKLLLQKDRVIEQLRLELAEAQIKVVETENAGGGRLQEVERQLMEARMTNARLMEDNESYQLLLQERTLNGDFKDHLGYMGNSSNADALDALEGRKPATSLADELSELGEEEVSVDVDKYRRLESEVKTARDQNKALTLYINKIIERLLQHSDFEAILDQSSDYKPSAVDKDLPPPPPPKDAGPSILERAKSVVGAARPKGRPMSMVPESQSAFNDPETAPRIPIGVSRSASTSARSRPMSEQFPRGVNIVNQMYKPPAGQISPPLYGPQSRRQSLFAPPPPSGNPNTGARVPSGPSSATMGSSGSFPGGAKSETSSISEGSGDISTPPSQSPPRPEKQITLAGNKPRPLRLVQAEDDKKAKRASWMGWAFGNKDGVAPSESIRE